MATGRIVREVIDDGGGLPGGNPGPDELWLAGTKGLANGEGVVDLGRVPTGKAVAVVPPAEFFAIILVGEAHDRGVAVQRLAEVGLQLLVGVTEERGIATIHRQVGEVVQRREDGELGKTRDTGHHHEADVADVVLDLAVKGGEFGADSLGLGDVVQRVTYRRVVLVNEDNHGLAAVSGKGFDSA